VIASRYDGLVTAGERLFGGDHFDWRLHIFRLGRLAKTCDPMLEL
jgi:hypothetical protein